MKHPLTDKRWQIIINNDTSFDGNFYYGVKTTGIFCKPSCHSKLPHRDNIVIFKTTTEAIKSGYRPCKRCHPTGSKVSDENWVEQIKAYLTNNYQKNLLLGQIAQDCHGSESNLQRTFKRLTNQSPTNYLLDLRLEKARVLLLESDYSIKTIALRCGFNSDTYFMTCFKNKFGQTPSTYQKKQLL